MFRGRGAGSSTTPSVHCKPAKCQANQEMLTKLTEIAQKAASNPNSNYVFTIKRAMKSLAECPQPITTYKQALTLKNIGPRLAQLICPSDQGMEDVHDTTTTNKTTTKTTTKRKPKTTQHKQEVGPSAKQKAYDQAFQHASNLVLPSGHWKVVLLVDGREQKSKQIVARCQQSGIPSEERHLPIGDMAWIARHMTATPTLEVMLGTILERKDTADLASSLFGTRYLEQRLRLQHCGLPQVLFLVEGDLHKCPNCPADTLLMCMMETRVQLGFQIVQTKHLEDSIRLLKGLHRRIVQRTFPQAFSKSLPDFGSPQLCPQNRKRRRPTSLLELVFDTAPVPPFGTTRCITYQELKAKVERDREAGTRTSGAVYMAMLKQVPTWSQKKCHALAQPYPTMHSLLTGFQNCYNNNGGGGDPSRMVQHVPCGDQQQRKIGPNSASELHVAFGTDGNGILQTNNSNDNNNNNDNNNTPVAAVARMPPPTTTAIPQAPFHDMISATVTNTSFSSSSSSPESSSRIHELQKKPAAKQRTAPITNFSSSSPESSWIQEQQKKPAAKQRTAPFQKRAPLSYSEPAPPQKPAAKKTPAPPPPSLSQSSCSCVDLTDDTPQPNRISAATATTVSQPFASMAESTTLRNDNAWQDTTWQSPKAATIMSSTTNHRKPPPSSTTSTSSGGTFGSPSESSSFSSSPGVLAAAAASSSSPVPHESLCVDLTQDTPQKKKPPPAAAATKKPSNMSSLLPPSRMLLEQEPESPLFTTPAVPKTRKPAPPLYSSASSSGRGMSPLSPADNSFSFSSPALLKTPTAASILHSGSLDRASRAALHATAALKRLAPTSSTKKPSPSWSKSSSSGASCLSPSILVVDSSEDEDEITPAPPTKTGIMASMPQRFVSNDSSSQQPSFPSAKLQLDSSEDEDDDADDLLDNEPSKKRAKPSEIIEID